MKIAIKNNSAIKIYSGNCSFEALSLFIEKEFQLKPASYALTYVDEDGDTITLATNEDMSSAYELNSNKTLLKVRLSPIQPTHEDEKQEFELIEAPAEPQETKEQPDKQEEGHSRKWHKHGCWGRNRSHRKSSSESSQEGHHGRGRFRMF
jgi:hypothetical protein